MNDQDAAQLLNSAARGGRSGDNKRGPAGAARGGLPAFRGPQWIAIGTWELHTPQDSTFPKACYDIQEPHQGGGEVCGSRAQPGCGCCPRSLPGRAGCGEGRGLCPQRRHQLGSGQPSPRAELIPHLGQPLLPHLLLCFPLLTKNRCFSFWILGSTTLLL